MSLDADEAVRRAMAPTADEVRRRFEGHAVKADGQLVFDQVLRINWFRKKAAGRESV